MFLIFLLGDKIATRAAYGTALAKLAENNDRVIALDGDTKNSTFSNAMLKVDPNRYVTFSNAMLKVDPNRYVKYKVQSRIAIAFCSICDFPF